MMKRFYLFLFLLFALSACSWKEYFTIYNGSTSNVKVRYELNLSVRGFHIFHHSPELFGSNGSGSILWDQQMTYTDLDSNKSVVELMLPPNSVLRFGELDNDNYEHHKQYFINDRQFNLERILIVSGKDSTLIERQQFDDYFKAKKGIISYTIQ